MEEDTVANKTENDVAEALNRVGGDGSRQECNGDRPEAQCSVCGELGHVARGEGCPLLRVHHSPDGYGDRSTTPTCILTNTLH